MFHWEKCDGAFAAPSIGVIQLFLIIRTLTEAGTEGFFELEIVNTTDFEKENNQNSV
jgi:hypothetical protein